MKVLLQILLLFSLASCKTLNLFEKNISGTNNDGASSSDACDNSAGFPPVPLSIPNSMFNTRKIFINTKDLISSGRPNLKLASEVDIEDTFLKTNSQLALSFNTNCLALNSHHQKSLSHRLKNQIPETVLETRDLKLPRYFVQWSPQKNISLNSFIELAESDPCLLYAESDMTVTPETATNDPQFENSDHLRSIGASAAYDIFYSPGAITQNVVYAVIDTGGDIDHPDLAANLWTNTGETPGNGIDDDGNGFIDDVHGYNFPSGTGNPNPELPAHNHGTEVAGITAARSDNAIGGSGVMGLHIKIMHLNVFGIAETTSFVNINNAIAYATNNGAEVINMSVGAYGYSPATESNLQAAVDAGLFMTSSAGNDSLLNTASEEAFHIPSNYSSTIDGLLSVAATYSTTGEITDYSNYSTTYVQIAAPGSESQSLGLFAPVQGSDPTTSYARAHGTSFSSPVVAGAGALAIGILKSRGSTYTPADIANYIKNSADTNSNLAGLIQECRALNLLRLAESL